MRVTFVYDHNHCTAKAKHLPGQMSYDKIAYLKDKHYDLDDAAAKRFISMGVAVPYGEANLEPDETPAPVKKVNPLSSKDLAPKDLAKASQ